MDFINKEVENTKQTLRNDDEYKLCCGNEHDIGMGVTDTGNRLKHKQVRIMEIEQSDTKRDRHLNRPLCKSTNKKKRTYREFPVIVTKYLFLDGRKFRF